MWACFHPMYHNSFKKIDIVEFDKALAEIAKDVILYLQINNVNVFNIDIRNSNQKINMI